MVKRATFTLEASFSGVVIGVDEAGCGPWAGPVVAAAAFLPSHKRITGIGDSKQLTPEIRQALYAKLMDSAHCAVGIASVEEIDALNILQARLLAMSRAIDALGLVPQMVLIDGNRAPAITHPLQTIVDGDAKCRCIAAASIIAKVTRDRMMAELARDYPGYGWETNAGYGTPPHQKALAQMGVTPHHRRSFRPIRELLEVSLRESA